MSWQDNRRRKRTWYKHYKRLCDEMMMRVTHSLGSKQPMPATFPVAMFYDLYERMHMHRRAKTARSAFKSMQLAFIDSGLARVELIPHHVHLKIPLPAGTITTQTCPNKLLSNHQSSALIPF